MEAQRAPGSKSKFQDPCFHNVSCPNLGREPIQIGRETYENGEQARNRAKQTASLASSLEV